MDDNHSSDHSAGSMRPFFIIWSGQAISLLGSQLVQFAIIWWLTITTESATVLAVASMVGLLPIVFIGPFAGALVDRWRRQTILLVADSVVALATALLALLFVLDVVQIWQVFALLFVRATAGAFHWPAMQASTTLMVPEEQLTRVGGLNQTLNGLVNIVIPPLGALAITVLPITSILAIDVATALPAILTLLVIPIPQPERQADSQDESGTSVFADMMAGWRYVWDWKGLLLFSSIGTVSNMLGRAAAALTPLVVLHHFGGGALGLGWIQASVGIGAVLGGVILGFWGGFDRRIVTAMVALAVDGIALLVFGLSPATAFWLAVAAIFVSGLSESILVGANGALFQSIVPPEMQGRVFSLLISVSQVATPLGLAIAGPVSDLTSAQSWYVIAGIAMLIMGAGAFAVPAIMNLEAEGKMPTETVNG